MTETALAISVILPTRNRADQLQGALERLAAQQTEGACTYEVLIVDNGSTDATRQVVDAWQPRFPVSLRYLYEGRTGKPWALNSGMAAARGAIFAFTDDDILTTPTWLAALWRCFQEEGADGVGGKILPQWTAPRPVWLTDEAFRRFGGLGCVDHGDLRRSSASGSYCRWVGGSFAVRRQAAARLGPYDPKLLRGEDTEYYERAISQGLAVCYEPSALAFHRIAADRMTLAYFRQVRHKTGYYRAYRMPWMLKDLVTIVPLWWYLDLLDTAAAWLKSGFGREQWMDRFQHELALREKTSLWLHRLQLWPRWWLAVLTGQRGQTP